MRELTMAAGPVSALLEFAISRGASREALMECSRIDPSDLRDREQRVPFSKYVLLMRTAKELCRDPALALHFGEAVPISEISYLGMIGSYAETIAEGLATANRYAPLAIEVDGGEVRDRIEFERGDGEVWIIDTRGNPNEFPELTESTFVRMVCTGRAHAGDLVRLKAVHFTHREPSYRAEYDRIFRVPLVFESRRNALLTDDSWMSWKPPLSSRPMFEILTERSEALLEKLESSKTVRGRVEALLEQLIQSGEATMDTVATRLGLSRQSVFRRLKAEGVTFEEVLDDVRRTLALRYLNGEELSVKETAFRLGFSEPASFSRAFKRWTGTSPQAARKKPRA